jgi:hypothetical protein
MAVDLVEDRERAVSKDGHFAAVWIGGINFGGDGLCR